jgi:hypothetical protein
MIQPEEVVFDGAAGPRPDSDMNELAQLADSLVEHLAETRRHYEELRTELDKVAPAPIAPANGDEQRAEKRDESEFDDPERVRLFALNQALSGLSEDEVRTELEEKFAFVDADQMVRSVFPHVPDSANGHHKRRFARLRGR